MNTTFKNIAAMTLCAVAALAVACDSPLSQEDSNKQMAEMSVLAIAGASAIGLQSVTIPANATIAGSCNVSPSSGCMDYYTGWTTGQMQADCNTVSGVFSAGGTGCNTAAKVGSCVYANRGFASNAGALSALRFYSPAHTSGSAQTGCISSGGTFSTN